MSHNYTKPPHIVPQVGNRRMYSPTQNVIVKQGGEEKSLQIQFYTHGRFIYYGRGYSCVISNRDRAGTKPPLFYQDLTSFQAHNKDVNDPCNNFTTWNVSLPVHELRSNRHKQERAVSFCTSLHTVGRSYKWFMSVSSFILTWALFWFRDVKGHKLIVIKLV